jgi:hypothetical protein
MNDADKVAIARWATWQFNEAVSLLREARTLLQGDLANEIDESLPNIHAALVAVTNAVSQ